MPLRMSIYTVVLLAVVVSTSAVGTIEGSPDSEPTADSVGAQLAGPVPATISYQGRATDSQGQPLNGSYAFAFQLWDDLAGGSQVGSDIVLSSVPIADGLFTVELPVNAALFTGQALWLRIQVDGQWLSPRQALLATPYALSLKPGALISGSESETATLNVDNSGGAPAVVAVAGALLPDLPRSEIGVLGAGSDTGVMGFADGDEGFGGSFTGPSGVSGSGQGGSGGFFSSIDGTGANAVSTNGTGLYAESGLVPLILWEGKDAIKANGEENGVVGWGGQSGGKFSGGYRGVEGTTDSVAEGGAGVFGESLDRNVDGVRGIGAHGVHGIGYTGVFGEGDVGVEGEGIVGVGGRSETGAGVHGESTSGVGVEGSSQTGLRV